MWDVGCGMSSGPHPALELPHPALGPPNGFYDAPGRTVGKYTERASSLSDRRMRRSYLRYRSRTVCLKQREPGSLATSRGAPAILRSR